MKLRWLRSLIRLFKAGFEYNFSFTIKPDYDYTKSSAENYRSENAVFDGPYQHIRETRNYDFHNYYTLDRQQWQDAAIRASVCKTDPQARPWMIFTCGAFGVGKGHVLSWLSEQGLFPLEYIVHVDPDFFKRVMPEWKGYLIRNQDFAGTATHPENIYARDCCGGSFGREAACMDRWKPTEL